MQRFDANHMPEDGWREFRKVAVTRAVQMDAPFEVETINGNIARGRPGDWLCVDSEGFPYPCEKFVFAAIYIPVELDEAA